MKCLAVGLALASAISLFGQTPKKIGVVLSFQGRWCRQAAAVATGDAIFLEDSITYCADRTSQADRIVIRFDGKTPYDRPYECSTPGICDTRAKLWLAGPDALQRFRSPGGALQSTPRIAVKTIDIDQIIQLGDDVDGWLKVVTDVSAGTPTIKLNSLEYCRLDASGKPVGCSRHLTTPLAGASIYAAFANGDRRAPLSVVGVVPRNSLGVAKWAEVPDVYKSSTDPLLVMERRAYLMDLVKVPHFQ
jgi:hypothetical protein